MLRQLVQVNLTQQQLNRELLEEQRKQTALLQEEVKKMVAMAVKGPAAATTGADPRRFLPRISEEDEIEDYLFNFERTAMQERWPESERAGHQGSVRFRKHGHPGTT